MGEGDKRKMRNWWKREWQIETQRDSKTFEQWQSFSNIDFLWFLVDDKESKRPLLIKDNLRKCLNFATILFEKQKELWRNWSRAREAEADREIEADRKTETVPNLEERKLEKR